MGEDMAHIVRGGCPHDCPDTCAWLVTVEDGVATKLVGDPEHPYTRGGLCAKVNRYLDRVYGPQRLLSPLRRTGPKGSGAFEPVSWDEALDDIAARLQRIVAESGGEAVLPYSYMGTQGFIQSRSMDRRFFARLGATRLERAICGSTGSVGIYHTLGSSDALAPEEIVHSRFIVLWGTNTIVTNLHLWPLIREAKANGATVVVVDPVRSRTAQAADWHVAPLPGTDAALALGMMAVIVREGLHDAEYIERYTVGFEQLVERLADYPPERVAAITGLEVEEIERLARAYATTRPALIRTLVGMEHREHGGMAYRAVACLPALVGAWRDVGGGLLHMTANLPFEALNTDALEMPHLEDHSLREVNMVQLGRALTDPTLDPPIRALVVYNSNPATIAPEQNKVLAGLRRDDLFTVVLEHVMTDTARHADYVLPATTQLEHWDLVWSWGQTYLTLNQPAIAPVGDALPNTEIFRRLAARMGFDEPYFQETDEQMIRAMLDVAHPLLGGATFDDLKERGWIRFAVPQGYRPYAEGGFPTRSGKCEFYSERLAKRGEDPLPNWTAPREQAMRDGYPLSLIAAKSALHFLNSSYAGLEHHRNAEREPLLDIHPFDAGPRDIADGAMVRVFNARGEVQVKARVGERVRPGVVALPFGWWPAHSRSSTSANALNQDTLSDWGGGGAFHDTLVEVTSDQ
ncbi:MAG: molybdopterin oxidoreductase [Chloroflexi bacterium]|nr:MAG: molybdopterin oxidoreductase [Chloroflexota bacterium]